MNNYDVKCRIMEEELKTFWPQWHVIRRLGGGAFGDVFEIYRDNFGIREKSALKMIQISDEPATMALIEPAGEAVSRVKVGQTEIPEAFQNEIRIMEALRGAPNIVTIEDFHLKKDASSTMLFVRMELLTSFRQMMADRQRDHLPFTIPEVLKIGRDICTALMYCEEKGIIHRDIKPANLFKDNFGNYKVGDFGVSRRMDTVHVALTMTGIGTISYMAPEVFSGRSYNNTVDIYALGLILYQLLNNCRVPFLPTKGSYTTKDIDSANYRRLHGEPLPSLTGTRIGNETVDASLDAMIRKACALRSEDRYQSAKAFYENLAVWGTPLAKKLQEDLPQKQQQEEKPQTISQQNSSLSERQSQNKNPTPDQTAHLLFTGNTQDEYTDTSRDIHRNPQTEQTPGLNTPGIVDSHSPGVKGDDTADSEQQRSGRSHITNYAIVFALVGVLIWLGYSLIGGIKQTAHSSSSSSSIASTDEAAATASLVASDEEEHALVEDDMSTTGETEDFVEIPDPVLKKAIQRTLGIGDREITETEALSLTKLEYNTYANDRHIEDITGLSAFRNLTKLYLPHNEISDISALSGLTNLKLLRLQGNQIEDVSALAGLTELTLLDLRYNNVSDISVLSGLTNLNRLYLSSNDVSDISALSGLTNLTKLNLGDNPLSDISALSGLTKLTTLYMCLNPLSDISALSGLMNLTKLDLHFNSLSDISALSDLTNLTELVLYSNQISDISALSGLKNLEELRLEDNKISDISALSGLTNMMWLDLTNNQISDISALSSLTNLGFLCLDGNTVLENKSREEIMEVLSGAENLEMSDF
ncbi:MAG: leucine-rich repeat domain-containing protein [Oscillospiraceae bacterium]|nr:leucine-rich repeat domain-containing protein [Oscillospiraceae bacterium]